MRKVGGGSVMVEDPTDTDKKRKLTVSYARVVGKDGRPRMIPSLSTGVEEFLPIEIAVKEIFDSSPEFRWAERFTA